MALDDHQRRPNSQVKLSLAKAHAANAQCREALGLVDEILKKSQFRKPELFQIGRGAARQCSEKNLEAKFSRELQQLFSRARARE